jgi:glutamine synthetase
MPLLAPYVNSYRRLVPGASAPINLSWGRDNRSVGLRVPVSDPAGRRLENRVAGADANPYLALAASLAAGFIGMDCGQKPKEPVGGNAYRKSYDLPRSLSDALKQFADCRPLRDLLGDEFARLYIAIKEEEMEAFMKVISPWERQYLLLNV